MVYSTAICDDEPICCKELQGYLKKYIDAQGIRCNIDVYHSGEDLLEGAKTTRYDLVFLDIELPRYNGTAIAKILRKKDANTQFIFVTNYETFAIEAFEVEAIGYVVKPIDEEKLIRDLNKAYVYIRNYYLNEVGDVISIKHEYETYELPLKEIVYMQKFKNKIQFFMCDGKVYDSYLSIKKLMEQLDEKQFTNIDQGTIINWKYVYDIDQQDIIVKCDHFTKGLFMARNKSAFLRKRFFQMLRES